MYHNWDEPHGIDQVNLVAMDFLLMRKSKWFKKDSKDKVMGNIVLLVLEKTRDHKLINFLIERQKYLQKCYGKFQIVLQEKEKRPSNVEILQKFVDNPFR